MNFVDTIHTTLFLLRNISDEDEDVEFEEMIEFSRRSIMCSASQQGTKH